MKTALLDFFNTLSNQLLPTFDIMLSQIISKEIGEPIANANGVYSGKFVPFIDKNSIYLGGFELVADKIEGSIC